VSILATVTESEQTITDERLVELSLGGDAGAFAELYDRFYPRTYRIAYGMTGRRASAEDLTQEIFMRAYERLKDYGGQSSFSTWFYRLAVNHSLNYRRHERGRAREQQHHDAEAIAEPRALRQVEAGVLQKQIQRQIQDALLALKPKLRVIVVLKDIEGLSYEEIAERANCSTGTVASRLNRARRLLARRLGHLKGAY
jgi:RNA polymerase sigma-70 factor (ECF subfamily)